MLQSTAVAFISERLQNCVAILLVTGAIAAAQTFNKSPAAVQVRPAALSAHPEAVGVADPGTTWPQVGGVATVYYQINPASGDTVNINAAISTSNADFPGILQWVNGTGAGTYVEINLNSADTSGACDVNSQGYPTTNPTVITMGGSGACTVATILHEMGHIIGLWHEQMRTDRDSYVTVNYSNVIKGSWPYDFAINTQNQQLLTDYDYASVMEYPPYSLSRNGGPVIETIPAGIPLQGSEGVPGAGNQDYSAGDKEAIARLYGKAPTQITITSNPVGLNVIVDGTTVTTPQTYSWALNSTHTLDIPSGVQTLTGNIENSSTSTTFYYTYGRWSDSTAQTHTITVMPGNGNPAFPRTAPQVATYSANFIQLVPYLSPAIFPSGAGTLTVSPQPQTYSGASGSFFVARQLVTLTATPAAGENFYQIISQSPFFYLPGGLSANPKTFYVPDTGNAVAPVAGFTTYPVYQVNVTPPSADTISSPFSANLWAYVDAAFIYTPQNFSPDPNFDGVGWNPGTSHTLNVNSGAPEYPYSSNSRYIFSSWNDGGPEQQTISSLPSSSVTYIATVTPEYQPATNFGFSPCGGSATISPASTEGGFYPWGTSLAFTATPNTGAGWLFGGWTYDLTGTTNPSSLTADDESLVYANFNTTGAPLSVTSLSPAFIPAGSAAFTLTVNGTGFASGSVVVVNGVYLTPVTILSSTQLQVQVPASLVASPTTFDVYVENYPTGWNGCANFAYDTFAVTGPQSTPTITWTPASFIFTGSAGSSVLNATANVSGTFAYSAAPTGGGSAVDITGGTSTLPAGTYTITATFNPTDPYLYASVQATATLYVSGNSVWIVNGTGGVSELAGNGAVASPSAYSGANATAAIDSTGNVWTVGTGSPLLEVISQLGASILTIPSGTGGLNAPTAIAIDGNGQAWVVNGNNSISEFSNAGAALSPSTGFTDTSISGPSGIAVDLGGSVWIANRGNNSLTRIIGVAAPVAPLSTAAANHTTGAKP